MTTEIKYNNPCKRPTSTNCTVEDYPDHVYCVGCYYFHPNLSGSKPPEKREETFMSKEDRDLHPVGKGSGGSGDKKEVSEITKLKILNCNLRLANLRLEAQGVMRAKEQIAVEEFRRLGCNPGEWLLDENSMQIVPVPVPEPPRPVTKPEQPGA